MWAFRSWPVRFTGLLGNQSLRGKTLAAFKSDFGSYVLVKAQPRHSAALEAILARSIFKQTSVQQFVLAFEELGYAEHNLTDVFDLVNKRAASIISSQASEDSFNVCKNSRMVKGKKQYRRPEKCYGIILARGNRGEDPPLQSGRG